MIVNRKEDDIIDREILKGPENMIIDDRVLKVNKIEYIEESYARLRLELSEFLHNNIKLQNELDTACNDMNVNKTKSLLTSILKNNNLITIAPN